jgi:hypothetical protein
MFAVALAAASTASAQAERGGNAALSRSEPWSFTITPYLWAAGLDGNTMADGLGSPIDTGYRFFSLDNLDLALAAGVEARKGRWTVLLDGLYVDFNDSFNGPLLATTDVQVSGGYFETSAAYPAAHIEGLDVVFGMRYVALEPTVRLDPGPEASRRASWLDPLVGVRFTHDFDGRWSVTLRGDIGGFGVSSELATNVAAIFSYRLANAMTLRFGYRALQMDFKENRFVFDALVQGYAVGLAFAL